MRKRKYCKVCRIKDQRQKEILETFILNRGFRRIPSKPLSFTQIAYICWVLWEFKITYKTLSKHYKECMGSPKRHAPIHYNLKLDKYIDEDGNIVPKEVYLKYHGHL